MHDHLSNASTPEEMPVLMGISLEGIGGMGLFRKGKVRDVFQNADQLIFISTDRVSVGDKRELRQRMSSRRKTQPWQPPKYSDW